MNLFWHRIVNIIFKPGKTWLEIRNEKMPAKELFSTYALTVAIIPAAVQFLKMSVIGTALLGFHFRFPIVSGLIHACFYYVLCIVGVFVVAGLIYFLAPSFGSRKDFDLAANLALFSVMPVWVGEVLILVPYVEFMFLFAALYGIVLLYLGLPVLMETPRNQVLMYFIVIMVTGFIVVPLVSIIPNLFFPRLPAL